VSRYRYDVVEKLRQALVDRRQHVVVGMPVTAEAFEVLAELDLDLVNALLVGHLEYAVAGDPGGDLAGAEALGKVVERPEASRRPVRHHARQDDRRRSPHVPPHEFVWGGKRDAFDGGRGHGARRHTPRTTVTSRARRVGG
jgi:hypothetical protein